MSIRQQYRRFGDDCLLKILNETQQIIDIVSKLPNVGHFSVDHVLEKRQPCIYIVYCGVLTLQRQFAEGIVTLNNISNMRVYTTYVLDMRIPIECIFTSYYVKLCDIGVTIFEAQ